MNHLTTTVPTLLIGLGGIGSDTVSLVRSRISSECPVAFLAIDTDMTEIGHLHDLKRHGSEERLFREDELFYLQPDQAAGSDGERGEGIWRRRRAGLRG